MDEVGCGCWGSYGWMVMVDGQLGVFSVCVSVCLCVCVCGVPCHSGGLVGWVRPGLPNLQSPLLSPLNRMNWTGWSQSVGSSRASVFSGPWSSVHRPLASHLPSYWTDCSLILGQQLIDVLG